MDVLSLMEDHWESHKPVPSKQSPRLFKSFSQLGTAHESSSNQMSSSQPLLQALMSSESSSNPTPIPISRAPASREVSAGSDAVVLQPTQSQDGTQSEGAGTPSSSMSSQDGSQDGSQLDQSETGSSAVSRHRYDEGLGPAPPLVTALLLLLMPLWLPVLTFFVLPLVFMWAMVAGGSLVVAGIFSMLNKWFATAPAIIRRQQRS